MHTRKRRVPSAPLAIVGALVLALVVSVATRADEPAEGTPLPALEPVIVETVDEMLAGNLVAVRGISSPRTATLELEERSLPIRDVLHLELAHVGDLRRELTVVLADGSRLMGSLGPRCDDASLDFNGALLAEGVRVPLEWVRRVEHVGIRRATQDGEAPRKQREEEIPPGEDAVLTNGGGVLLGVVELINGRGVRIEDRKLDDTVEVLWERIHTVVIAPLDPPPESAPDALRVVLEGADGSLLHGALQRLEAGTVVLESPLIGSLELPLSRLAGIEINLGRVVPLSARDPVRVKQGNPFTDPQTFEQFFGWRRDLNVVGGPLIIGERRFRRGLGVHSECRLTYAVQPGDRTFQSWVGIDIAGRPVEDQTEIASVVFRVLLDGKERFNSGNVNWQSPPRRVELDLDGAAEFELIVDMGKGFHILDRADWGDARILRE